MMNPCRILVLLVAAIIGASSALPATAASEFVYRYRMEARAGGEDATSKSISASFVGGIGVEFSERLPLKPDWEDDDWSVVDGDLPDGISFNPASLTFEGVPEKEGLGTTVRLEGHAANGAWVGQATVAFDIRALRGVPVEIDYYAHTGKYRFLQLDIPAGLTVDSWDILYAPPPGVVISGRNFDGTPATAGSFRVFIYGKDYLGNYVATFFGKYVVEDAPTFPLIPDFVAPLPALETDGGLDIAFGAPSTHSVRRAIGTPANVRYALELAAGETMPNGVYSNEKPRDLRIVGTITAPYQTSRARYKAIDSDGAEGFSNWFVWGSSDPSPACRPASVPGRITVYTGKAVSIPLVLSEGGQGTLGYQMLSGSLPDALSFDSVSGRITGTPTRAVPASDFSVRIDVDNNGNMVSAECHYTIEVRNSSLKLSDSTPGQNHHVRAGALFEGLLTTSGGIPTYSVGLESTSSWPTFSITSGQTNSSSTSLSGVLISPAMPHLVEFTVTNGDGNKASRSIPVYVHGPLSWPDIPRISVKKYAASREWHVVGYDDDTVIPDVTGTIEYPMIKNVSSSPLPAGLAFDGRAFIGAVTAAAGEYGPFVLQMSDQSGDTILSNKFSIEVEDREPVRLSTPASPTIVIGKGGNFHPSAAIQPVGATALKLAWSIAGSMPSWMGFDPATGTIISQPPTFEDIGAYGPFKLTVTDSEGYSATSDEFAVNVIDIPAPAAISPPITISNLTTPTHPVATTTPALDEVLDLETIVGTKGDVRFRTDDVALPDGLSVDPLTGSIRGFATSEFSGTIQVIITDGKGRRGTVGVPLRILPYPAISVSDDYELPRLAEAGNYPIVPVANGGFWGTVAWALDRNSAPLPSGLSVDPASGRIKGVTDAATGSFNGIILTATDAGGSGLQAASVPFTLNIQEREDITLRYIRPVTFRMTENVTGGFDPLDSDAGQSVPRLSGSWVTPTSFRILGQLPLELSGVSINPDTGVLVGSPSGLGEWELGVEVTDGDTPPFKATATLAIKSTLAGFIVPQNGGGVIAVRSGETFSTSDLVVGNKVGGVSFSTSQTPASLFFSPTYGSFAGSVSNTAGAMSQHLFEVQATDDGGRHFEKPIKYTLQVYPPLAMESGETSFQATQYSAEDPVAIAFPPARHAMGDITYEIVGDLPGTKVISNYLGGQFADYSWVTDGVSHRTPNLTDLPADAIIFDPAARTIKGIPSIEGVFKFRVVASDSHKDAYLNPNDETRGSFNTASTSELTLTVGKAADLAVASTATPKGVVVPDGNAHAVVSASGAAYGKPVTWSVSGATALPTGISYSVVDGGVVFSGYTTDLGTYDGIIVKATDAAGRTASVTQRFDVILSTDPIGLSVAAIETKVGYQFATPRPTVGNQYGVVRFYSYDIERDHAAQMRLDSSTGVVSGSFGEVQNFEVDLYVSDDTNRVTSRPVQVRVIPDMRIVVPSQMVFEPFTQMQSVPDVDYVLGRTSFTLQGNLPAGMSFDPVTGAITSDGTTPIGSYGNFTISGTDTFQFGQVDTQASNQFEIAVRSSGPYIGLATAPLEEAVWRTSAYHQDIAPASLTLKNVLPSEVSWSLSADPQLGQKVPEGLSIDHGVLSGTIGEAGEFSFIVTASFVDNPSVSSSAVYSLKVSRPVFKDIAAGLNHTCGVTSAGSALCWGSNTSGQLGDGTLSTRSTAALVEGLSTGVEHITVGYAHSCALTTVGDVYCWGQNVGGQLGIGSTGAGERTPVRVLSGALQVEAGYYHTCAVTLGNVLKCWGDNANGQIGDGTTAVSRSSPTDVVDIGPVAQVSTGYVHTCAINMDGTPFCWGLNRYGSHGDGTATQHLRPTPISSETGNMTSVVAGHWHTCGITKAGEQLCWGSNSNGQIGDDSLTDRRTPTAVSGLPSGMSHGIAAESMSCGITSSGGLLCWGLNSGGRLGDGSTAQRRTPVTIAPLGATVVSSTSGHTCAIISGNPMCWGANGNGQIGDGTTATRLAPTLIK